MEHAYVTNARRGCLTSLNKLLTNYRPRIYWFVRRMGVGRHHDVEELTQETLIQVQRSIARFEGRSKISSWIFSIAKNVVKNHLSRSAQYRYTFIDIATEDFEDETRKGPLSCAMGDSSRECLMKNIESLADHLKQPILLVGFRELSYAETAEILNISVPILKSRLFRARQVLRGLKESEEELVTE